MTALILSFDRKPPQIIPDEGQVVTPLDFEKLYAGYYFIQVRNDKMSLDELRGIAKGAQSVIDLMTGKGES